jgi:hypothetical protein
MPYASMIELWNSSDLELACCKGMRLLNWGDEDTMKCGCCTESTS